MSKSVAVKKLLRTFGKFLYNKETHEILTRTCSGWAQIGLFFMVFYFILGVIFAIHLALFLAITPGPAVGRPPWNHGRYAYTNYPNRRIELLLTPRQFTFDRGTGEAILSSYDYRYMSRLISGANASKVESTCLDRESRFGFSIGKPCIYLHIAKVFDWTAGLINSTLLEETELPFNCTFSSDEMDLFIPLTRQPRALPLNLSNNDNSRSFPFVNQPNYRVPVIGLSLNLTSIPEGLPRAFDGEIMCIVDFGAIGMARPSNLNRLYEIPTQTTTRIRFR